MNAPAEPECVPLSDEDRAILDLECATVVGHVLHGSILDGPVVDAAALREQIAARLPAAPELRYRLDERIRSNTTAARMKLPTKVPCQKGLTPAMSSAFRITSTNKAPMAAPSALPKPPVNEAPPMTVEAMTWSS